VDWIRLTKGYAEMAGCYEQGNETSVFKTRRVEQLSASQAGLCSMELVILAGFHPTTV
jgi:hypothetical protein